MAETERKDSNAGANRVAEPMTTYLSLPEQKGFFKIPARFGHVPVAEEPLGYDKERRFEHHYPRIELPFQVVDVVKTGAEQLGEVNELFPYGRNRLFFGDCLHVMRMLPSESIDLIYVDPPFFSGRNYNIIFGDRNEVRSFSDIWEGGMPGYLIWLNARLYEMKRLLKPTGSIFVHLDWHASHYVKSEMDRIYGYENFRNEIIWHYGGRVMANKRNFAAKHDNILFYARGPDNKFRGFTVPWSREEYLRIRKQKIQKDQGGREYVVQPVGSGEETYKAYLDEVLNRGKAVDTTWDIRIIAGLSSERIGYPTQKPIELLQRIIEATTEPGDVVADFFCGGGSFIEAAQGSRAREDSDGALRVYHEPGLARRWIGCDISRVAVAITADRIARTLAPNLQEVRRAAKQTRGDPQNLLGLVVENHTLTSVEETKKKAVEASPLRETGYSVEHWGIYEIQRLTKLSPEEFRAFVLACYGARKWTGSDRSIHGVKGNELLWVAGPKETDVVTATDVKSFAQAVMKSRKPEERQAVMIGWNIDPKARAYAEQVMALGEQKPIQFIKLRLWPLAGEEFKTHVTKKHDKYKDFFGFILPPDIPRIGVTRLSRLKYRFDISEARSMNTGGRIVNVQWDFDFHNGIFSATQGYQLRRKEKKGRGESGFEGEMTVEYTFGDLEPGSEITIACRVQDDLGGEGMKTMKLMVE